MATKKIKINFKMPTPTAAERLHAQQQKNRKAAGLPDPSEYKKKLDAMKKENYEEDDGPLSQEQLDEISSQLKASYVSGAKKQIKQSLPFTKKTDEYRDIAKNFIAKRQKGIAKANEEVEQLDEIGNTSAGRKTLGNYINRSHESGDAARIQATYDKDNFTKHTKTVAKRSSGIAKAVTRLTKEQLEKKGRFVSGPTKQPFKSNTIVTAVKEGFKMGRGNVHEYDRNPPPKDGSELENVPFHAKTEHQKKLQKALTDLGNKMKETHPKLKEDLSDKITVFKKGTNVKQKISSNSYDTFKAHGFRKTVAEEKDSQEYDYEGDMAKSDLRSIIHNAQTLHDMLDDNTNLAEWCQSKITLAEDYISTVTNYMRSEMNEEVDLEEAKKMEYNQKDVYHLQGCVRELESMKKQISKLAGNHDAVFKTIDKAIDVFAKEYTKHLNALSAGRGQDDNFKVAELFSSLKFKKSTKKKKTNEEVEYIDEKKNLPGLWANIRAKKARGEPPAKPGDKDYPKTLNIESTHDVPFNKPYNKDSGTTTDKSGAKHTPMSKARHLARQAMNKTTNKPVKESASEPTEGEMKGKQGYSRKAQIVVNASKGKKSDNPDKFQKDPELSSEIHKT